MPDIQNTVESKMMFQSTVAPSADCLRSRRIEVGRPSLKGGVTEKDFIGFAVLSTPLFPLKGEVSTKVFLMNTPELETPRLLLRKFTSDDLPALFAIYGDEEVNVHLPWFPLRSMEEASRFLEERYVRAYAEDCGYRYAVCLKADAVPIGYVNVGTDDSHDLGYGLRKEFWRQGIAREAAQAVIEQVRRDGMPYVTATHDVRNPRSGSVMRAVGMRYMYSYEELWQPKNLLVTFRMYQLNLDGVDRVYRAYWNRYPKHFIENL